MECVGVEYRVELTLASIGQGNKKGVKAVVLLVLFMADGSQQKMYFSLAQF